MRWIFLSLGFVILTVCVAWLVYLNPGHTVLKLAPDLFVDVPTVALVLLSMALGGFLAVVSAGFAEVRHLLSGWRTTKLKKREDRIQDLLQQAVSAKALGRYDEASGLFQKILSLDPSHVGTLLRLGNIYRLQGNVTEAIRLHRKARGLKEKNIDVLLALAKDFEQIGRVEDASQILHEVQRNDGGTTTVQIQLRDLLVKLGRWEEAHSVQERILRGTLSPEELKVEQAWLDGIGYELGRERLEQGDRDRARRQFRAIVKQSPNFIPAQIGLGEISIQEGRPEEAGELWKKAFEAASSFLLLHRLEDLYLDLGEPAKIIRLFQEALERHPENSVLRFYLGKLYYRLEMVDDALDILAVLDAHVEKMPDLHKLLGNLYLRKGNTEGAVEEFKKALNLRKRVLIPYYCPICDYHTDQWSGRCPRCGHWNSFEASPIMKEWAPIETISKAERV